ncbi:hypothetical protein [Maridesulfovibrio ferrireducens]|uniref:hypothetical protein n=1 Tax=Maridesulfovibrio ferrireducens TaxID=246191 RepID=UPI001A209F7D|nr:hypothetical protein [Maridesulfovibrio ferrireducens]MBI9112697.1 hypothetical protein [Maridesulfovibrio ferrireducens]
MNKAKVLTLIQEVLDQKEAVTMTDSHQTLEKWDSLAQLQILTRIDQETDGKAANIPELAIALSVEEIIGTLDSHGLIDA